MDHYIRLGREPVAVIHKLDSIYGEHTAGGANLRISLRLGLLGHPDASVEAAGELVPTRMSLELEQPTRMLIGDGYGIETILVPMSHDERPYTVVFPLSDTAIARIDEARRGGPFTIGLTLRFSSVLKGKAARSETRVSHTVSRDDWASLASQLRQVSPLLLELPRPSGELNSKALVQYDVAVEARRNGRYRDVLVACRRALEAAGIEATPDLPSTNGPSPFSGGRDWTFDQRLRVLREALRVVLHGGAHENEGTREPTPDEAAFVVAATAGALKLWGAK